MSSFLHKIGIGLMLAASLLAAACSGAEITDDTRLPRGAVIDGIDVSRMTVSEAAAVLDAHHRALIEETVFTLSLPGTVRTVSASELGVTAAAREAAEQAVRLGRNNEGAAISVDWHLPDASAGQMATEIASASSKSPRNASVAVDFSEREPFLYTPEADGVSVQTESVGSALRQAVEGKRSCALSIPSDTLAATLRLETLQAERTLLARYSTSYAEYPYNKENRVFNIEKAASLINGTILAPGDTFDCNAVLGDRNAENGWRTATGIRNGAYVNEYGGGVCQVSSTLFNAVLLADLDITERHPHSWPMGYVETGRDATISTGGKNLIFVNSTVGSLYLSVWTDEDQKTVTVSIYGTPPASGETVSVFSELISRLPDEGSEIRLDESLPANTRVVVRDARAGCVSRTYKTYHSPDGTELRQELAYEDVYHSIKGLTYVSPDIYYS